MPLDSWRNRGNYGTRPNYKRSGSGFPSDQDYYKPKNEKLPCCYHFTQQSSQMCDDMYRRLRLGKMEKRLFDAERRCGNNLEHCPDFLKQEPLSGDVTLTVEVPNADYPSIIDMSNPYQGDDSIPLIMQETGVRVQFPDAVTYGANPSLVNQVRLIGPLEKVEEARKRIRKLAPIAVAFPLDFPQGQGLQEKLRKVVEDKLQEQRLQYPHLKILLTIRPPSVGQFFREIYQNAEIPICVVEGAASREKDIQEVCEAIGTLFPKNDDGEVWQQFCVSWMDIPVSQQLVVTGVLNGFLMRFISLRSNAAIFFPTPVDRRIGATMFYFTGAVGATLRARKFIEALLPVSLSFEVEHTDLVDPLKVPCYYRDEKFDAKVQIKCSTDFERIFTDDPIRDHVIIESTELNVVNLYKIRNKLLKTFENKCNDVSSEQCNFFDEEFRAVVKQNNRVIAENESVVPLRAGVARIPAFDPKVPAPNCSAEAQRRVGWQETVRPQQAWVVGHFQPTTTYSGPVYVPNGGPRWVPPLQHSSSLPTFGYQPYQSPSTTIISDDRSLADIKTEHTQCSSNDVPTTAVQHFLDSFKTSQTKPSFKRHESMNRTTQYV